MSDLPLDWENRPLAERDRLMREAGWTYCERLNYLTCTPEFIAAMQRALEREKHDGEGVVAEQDDVDGGSDGGSGRPGLDSGAGLDRGASPAG